MVAVLLRMGLDVLKVRAGSRLGHRDGRDTVAADQLRQPLFLLLFAAIGVDVMDHDGLDAIAPPHVSGTPLFVNGNRIEPDTAAEPAIVFGDRAPHDALLSGGLPELAVHDPLLGPFFDIRGHFGIKKLARAIRKYLVFIRRPTRRVLDQRHVSYLSSQAFIWRNLTSVPFLDNDPEQLMTKRHRLLHHASPGGSVGPAFHSPHAKKGPPVWRAFP